MMVCARLELAFISVAATDRFLRCLPSLPASFFHLLFDRRVVLHQVLAESLYVHSEGLVFSNLQAFFWPLVDRDKQVLNSFVVDLKHRDVNFILLVLLLIVVNSREYFLAADWHDSLVGTVSDHGIAFTRPSLAVSKQTAVIALPCIVEDFNTDGFEDSLLVGVLLGIGPRSQMSLLEIARGRRGELVVGPEGIVEGEVAISFRIFEVEQPGGIADHFDAELAVEFNLTSVERTHSHSDFDAHQIQL